MSEDRGYITHPLHQRRHRSPGAENQFFDLVVANLHPLAHPIMRRGQNHTLQTTKLVNQIYLPPRLGAPRRLAEPAPFFSLLLVEPAAKRFDRLYARTARREICCT